MENRVPTGSDPFEDPISVAEQSDFGEHSTLVVGRNASLTLGTDSLIVLGMSLCRSVWPDFKYLYVV